MVDILEDPTCLSNRPPCCQPSVLLSLSDGEGLESVQRLPGRSGPETLPSHPVVVSLLQMLLTPLVAVCRTKRTDYNHSKNMGKNLVVFQFREDLAEQFARQLCQLFFQSLERLVGLHANLLPSPDMASIKLF